MNIDPNSRHFRSTRALAEANWALSASFAHLASAPKAAQPPGEIVNVRSFPRRSLDGSELSFTTLPSYVVDPAAANASAARAVYLMQSEPDALTILHGHMLSPGVDRLLDSI
jgi:hypothetical protein